MFHPLAPDLSGLSDDQLYEKINELNKRMNQAFRLGGAEAFRQMQMLMYNYQQELQTRNKAKLDAMAKQNPGWDKIIDIK